MGEVEEAVMMVGEEKDEAVMDEAVMDEAVMEEAVMDGVGMEASRGRADGPRQTPP